MSTNERGFGPFTLSQGSDLFNSIKGLKQNKALWSKTNNYERVTAFLNTKARNMNTSETKENRFMEVFYGTTEELMADKYKL